MICGPAEYQLIQDLLHDYDVNARPVNTPLDVVNVSIGLHFTQILKLVGAQIAVILIV